MVHPNLIGHRRRDAFINTELILAEFLRVSFCGSREGSKLAYLLNGSQLGTTLALPEDGTMHRDSHRGMWFEKTVDIPAARLKTGENILQFRLSGNAWHQGVLYDYIRLEAVDAQAPSL